jgi:hypothetical protein
VTTTEPTSTDDNAFWMTYTAQDSAGNVAQAFRQVLVVCSSGEAICQAGKTDRKASCSVNGQCLDEDVAAVMSGTRGAEETGAHMGTMSSSWRRRFKHPRECAHLRCLTIILVLTV